MSNRATSNEAKFIFQHLGVIVRVQSGGVETDQSLNELQLCLLLNNFVYSFNIALFSNTELCIQISNIQFAYKQSIFPLLR